MDMNDLILVSVDDHVVEPPDMWERHVSKADLERAPRVIHKDELDADVWTFEGIEIPNVGLNAVAGRPPEEYGIEPTAFDEIRPGCYDIHERIRDMNVNGVLGSMCFPSMTGFCGQLFSRTAGPASSASRLLQGYNDWHIDEWCGTYPGRFIPLAHRADLGPRAHGRRGAPGRGEGLPRRHVLREPRPSSATRASTPTTGTRSGRRARTTGTVVCLHIGSSSPIVDHLRRRAGRRDDHGHAGQHRACARPT